MSSPLPAFVHDEEIIAYLTDMSARIANECGREIEIIASGHSKGAGSNFLICDRNRNGDQLPTITGATIEIAWAALRTKLAEHVASRSDRAEKMRAQAKDLLKKADALDAGTPQLPQPKMP